MPDGVILPTETTAPELAADTADSRLLRHVRRNLVLWSGGTTLLILVALAAALYFAAASSLASVRRRPARAADEPGLRASAPTRTTVAVRLRVRGRRRRSR